VTGKIGYRFSFATSANGAGADIMRKPSRNWRAKAGRQEDRQAL